MSPVQRFTRNTLGRDFVVGDLHGSYTRLKRALDLLNFNPSIDRVFVTGDLGDRGPESLDALRWLKQPWFHSVRGNHCHTAIKIAKSQFTTKDEIKQRLFFAKNGGQWLVDLCDRQSDAVTQVIEAFEALPFAIEVETAEGPIGIIHAQSLPSWTDTVGYLEDPQSLTCEGRKKFFSNCLYARSKRKCMDESYYQGIARVFHGHTVVPRPLVLGNAHYIDTGIVFNYSLTLVDLAHPHFPYVFPAHVLDQPLHALRNDVA